MNIFDSVPPEVANAYLGTLANASIVMFDNMRQFRLKQALEDTWNPEKRRAICRELTELNNRRQARFAP